MVKCINPDCENVKIFGRGMCNKCYKRYNKYGNFERKTQVNIDKKCINEECNNLAIAKGMCSICYKRYKRIGTFQLKEKIESKCINPECENMTFAVSGMCQKCWFRMKRRGTFELSRNSPVLHTTHCSECGTTDNIRGYWNRGMCSRCYDMNKYYNDITFRLHNNLSSQLFAHLNRYDTVKSGRLEDIMGCSIKDFRKYIDDSFQDGMNWENKSLWEIDHILPKRLFDPTDEKQLKICWNWKNLKPMWKDDNINKSDILPDGSRARDFRGDVISLVDESFPALLSEVFNASTT